MPLINNSKLSDKVNNRRIDYTGNIISVYVNKATNVFSISFHILNKNDHNINPVGYNMIVEDGYINFNAPLDIKISNSNTEIEVVIKQKIIDFLRDYPYINERFSLMYSSEGIITSFTGTGGEFFNDLSN